MALANDLMDLGVPPLQAARTALAGGTGPLTIVPVGTSFASATKIGCTQFLVTVAGAVNNLGVSLPPIGGDTGALIADPFIINNQTTTASGSVVVYASTSVLISMNGSLSSIQRVVAHTTAVFYPVLVPVAPGSATANWIGISGT